MPTPRLYPDKLWASQNLPGVDLKVYPRGRLRRLQKSAHPLQNVLYEYCFTSLSAQSWQYRDRRKPEAGTMPYSYFEWLRWFCRIYPLSHNYMKGRLCYTITKSLFRYCISFYYSGHDLPFKTVYCHVEAKLPSSLRILYHWVSVTLITTLLQGSSRLLSTPHWSCVVFYLLSLGANISKHVDLGIYIW